MQYYSISEINHLITVTLSSHPIPVFILQFSIIQSHPFTAFYLPPIKLSTPVNSVFYLSHHYGVLHNLLYYIDLSLSHTFTEPVLINNSIHKFLR